MRSVAGSQPSSNMDGMIRHGQRLAVARKRRPPYVMGQMLFAIRHGPETPLFLPVFDIPYSHHAIAMIDGDEPLAGFGERQVVGIPFETGKAVHEFVGGDVVQADARAV